ncbi:hypothetical protein FB566_4463 [Stackebrandtia endophytica]|uniref:SecDF P1 head subdomain domain-containing protein n=2 Tax=Stackebrandtia endophytica TaxID=1496996 RepID=A0A543B1Z9_9ACTN|nr:hypothetical protein FB566_4463 [Stackebrandtia endophytica]
MASVVATAALVAACSQTGLVTEPTEAESLDPVQLQFRPVVAAVAISSPAGGALGEATATNLDQVWEKVGDEAAELASNLTTVPQTEADLATLAPFAQLAPSEVALLPTSVRLFVPTIGCDQLTTDAEYFEPSTETVVCDFEDGNPTEKLHLGPVELDGSHVTGAESATSQVQPGAWVVTVTFTDEGTAAFADLTAEYINGRVAVVLATEVITAPTIISTITNGVVEISGLSGEGEAVELARAINSATE